MEEQPLPSGPSLGASIINVLSAPSEAFSGLHKTESKPSLWIVPLLVTIAMVIGTLIVGFMNESLKQQRLDATRLVLEKRVTDGKMTQEQLDQTMEGMERGGGIVLAVQIVAVTIIFSLFFFLTALFLWLGSKTILKSPAGYGKILELSGIASWIGALGVLVQILMMVGLNSLYAHPSLGLIVYQDFDPTNTLHKILALVNFFGIWQTVVIGIGLQKWSEKSISFAMSVSFGIWILTLGLMYLMGLTG